MNQLYGVQSEVPSFLESSHRIVNVKSAKNYVKRLRAITAKFDQVLESLKVREEMDAIPPRFAVTKVIAQVEQFIAIPSMVNILYISFEKKIDDCENIDEDDRGKFKNDVISEIEDSVYPAYRKLLAYLKNLEDRAVNRSSPIMRT